MGVGEDKIGGLNVHSVNTSCNRHQMRTPTCASWRDLSQSGQQECAVYFSLRPMHHRPLLHSRPQ